MNEDWDSNLFDAHDLEELDALLADLPGDEALRVDGAQGLLTALAIGPQALEPSDWLPLVLGEDPDLLSFDGVERIVQMLLKLAANVHQSLEHYVYEPVFMQHDEDGESAIDPGGWCEGFAIGVDLLGERWEQALQEDPSLLPMLEPIMRLGVESGVFEEIHRADLAALTEDEREALIRSLPTRLVDLRHYWEEHGGDTARHVQLH